MNAASWSLSSDVGDHGGVGAKVAMASFEMKFLVVSADILLMASIILTVVILILSSTNIATNRHTARHTALHNMRHIGSQDKLCSRG